MAALTYLQRPCDVIAGICLVHENRQVQLIRKPLARQADFTVDNLADVSGRWADGYFFYQPEVFFSRSIWERVGGNVNEDLHYAMDHDLWMRCAQMGAKLEVVDYPFALFRKHDQQKTVNRDVAVKEQFQVARGYLSSQVEVASSNGSQSSARNDHASTSQMNRAKSDHLTSNQYLDKGRDLKQQGHLTAAVNLYREAINLYPEDADLYRELGLVLEEVKKKD